MSTDLGVVILSGALPLVGVLIGAGATVSVQRGSARESQRRTAAERRQAQRAEVKNSIVSYLEIAQHLQTQLYAREHGKEIPDLPVMVEQVWLAQMQVDIICSEELRKPVQRHALALNEVARHETEHPDWWEFVSPHVEVLLNAMRAELRWPDDDESLVSRKPSRHDQVMADQHGAVGEVKERNRDLDPEPPD